MITDRDKQIILHMEKYKYATIEQMEKIFFRQQKNSYNIARRRMAEIRKTGYIRSVRNMENNKIIYIYNDNKTRTPDRHRLLVLDVLANLHWFGFDVHLFEIEKEWKDGEIRSDAFTIFANDSLKIRYQFFVEVHLSNNKCNLEKYDILHETKEVQECSGIQKYPRILLVADRKYNYKVESTSVIQLNTKLDDFMNIILPTK